VGDVTDAEERRREAPVADDELRAELDRMLMSRFGAAGRVAALQRRPLAERTSFAIEALDVQLTGGRALELVLKDVGPSGLSHATRHARPPFLYDELREISTYRTIIAPERVSSPALIGAVVAPERARLWLVLERVRGNPLWREGSLTVWERAAAWLARVHTRLAPVAAARAQAARLLRHDAGLFRAWPARAARFGRLEGALAGLPDRYEPVVEHLASLPVTLVHGEFYASNVMVRTGAPRRSVCPVDWELAGLGPGLLDLAALTAGRWTEVQRTAMALAYHRALPRSARPGRDELLASLAICRLHVAVQWLGWAEEWSAPAEHQQDWLAEATALAQRLLP
jgi:aminoglycoside phosphotransferase (APT) family kinase protein